MVRSWLWLLILQHPDPHQETIQYFLIYLSSPGVLGAPWLACHSPQFDWLAGRLTSCRITCLSNCLRSALSSPSSPEAVLEVLYLYTFPVQYHDLHEAFGKQHLFIPPPRPYDCGINLLPGASLLSNHQLISTRVGSHGEVLLRNVDGLCDLSIIIRLWGRFLHHPKEG